MGLRDGEALRKNKKLLIFNIDKWKKNGTCCIQGLEVKKELQLI
jgi:hypothetical protein